MTPEDPSVSVVIPTFNGAGFVSEAIESALSQTYPITELIVQDDGSTDDTLRVVRSIRDRRIGVHSAHVNQGAAANWNLGLRRASGKYVKILPQDDLLHDRAIEMQVEELESTGAVLCAGSRRLIGARGRTVIPRIPLQLESGVHDQASVLDAAIRSASNPLGEGGAVLFKREAAIGIDFRASAGYMLDFDFFLRLLDRGDAYVIEEVLSSFRLHPMSWTSQLRSRQASETISWLRQQEVPLHTSIVAHRMVAPRALIRAGGRASLGTFAWVCRR